MQTLKNEDKPFQLVPRRMPGLSKPLIIVFLLSGCLGPSISGPPGEGQSTLDDEVRQPVDMSGTPPALADHEPWSRWELNARGDAGTWLVLYRAIPEEAGGGGPFTYATEYEVAADASATGPNGIYLMPPQLLVGNATFNGPDLHDLRFAIDWEGGQISIADAESRTIEYLTQSRIMGFLVVIGSNSAWQADLVVTRDSDAGVTGPSFTRIGRGVTISDPGQHVAAGLPSDVHTTELELKQPGLTHVGFDWDLLESSPAPVVKHCRIDWNPDDDSSCLDATVVDTGWVYGRYNNITAKASVHMAFVKPTTDYRAYIMHLPGGRDMFPANMYLDGYAFQTRQSDGDVIRDSLPCITCLALRE